MDKKLTQQNLSVDELRDTKEQTPDPLLNCQWNSEKRNRSELYDDHLHTIKIEQSEQLTVVWLFNRGQITKGQ